MLKRTIEISSQRTHLSMRQGQLTLTRDGNPIASVPCEDVGAVIVDQSQTTYTHAVLRDLASGGGSLVVCGHDHLPVGLLIPFGNHCQVVQRINEQVDATAPTKKRIWQQLIRAKIKASAPILDPSPVASRLRALVSHVRSGDPTNVEARAAKLFWANWLPAHCEFRRDKEGEAFNGLLNYGYAIVRALLARAIVSGGYLPAIGIHHHHRSNAFCLADDLMEPLRPFVDSIVRDLHRQGFGEVNRETKQQLLELLTMTVQLGKNKGPLNVVIHRYVSSFGDCLRGESRTLQIPVAISGEGKTRLWN